MLKKINIDNILLHLLDQSKVPNVWYLSKIEESHLWKVLKGDDNPFMTYYSYSEKKEKSEERLKDYKELAKNFKYLDTEFKNSYIIVKEHGFPNMYKTIDGDHRLSILKYMGEKEVLCEVR